MPPFSRLVSRVSPSLLRAIRNYFFIEMDEILSALPSTGSVLEVGCGYGHVISVLARRRPDLFFVGVDPDSDAIERAGKSWSLQNLSFSNRPVEIVRETFDLVLLLDVIHHLPSGAEGVLLSHCAQRLKTDGRLLLKEIPLQNCAVGVWTDRYISRCPPLVRSDDQLRSAIEPFFRVLNWKEGSRLGMGHLYVFAMPRALRRESALENQRDQGSAAQSTGA